MSYLKKISLITLIIILASAYARAYNRYYIVKDKTYRLRAENFHGSDYFDLEKLARIILPGSKFESERYEIKSGQFTLKVVPATFFIVSDEKNNMKISQMNLPALNISGKTFVPVNSFFRTLQSLGMFTVTFDKNKIILKDAGNAEPEEHISGNDKIADEDKTSDENISSEPDNGNVDISESNRTLNKEPAKSKSQKNEGDIIIARSFRMNSGAFISALNTIDESENILTLPVENNGNIDKAPETEQNNSESTIPLQKNNDADIIENQYPPNLYVLPRNLIRRELGDKRKKEDPKTD